MNWFTDLLKSLFVTEPSSEPFGLIDDPVDYRDLPAEKLQDTTIPTELPSEYRVPYNLFVSDQKSKPHCVAHVGCSMKEELERRENIHVKFDTEWLYKKCKENDGMPHLRGTSFRTMLKVLQKIGCKPLEEPESEASKYRIGGYAKIYNITDESLARAIYQYHTILMGFRGSNEGWSRKLKGNIRAPKKGERVWLHGTLGDGFLNSDKITILGQNSWGLDWGRDGKFMIDSSYLPYSAYMILTDLPNNWKELVGLDDEPPKFKFERDLYFPMKDPDVIQLQRCLKYKGCFPVDTECIDRFGPKTLEAVKLFQQRYGIEPVEGYVGPLTRYKLNQMFA